MEQLNIKSCVLKQEGKPTLYSFDLSREFEHIEGLVYNRIELFENYVNGSCRVYSYTQPLTLTNVQVKRRHFALTNLDRIIKIMENTMPERAVK